MSLKVWRATRGFFGSLYQQLLEDNIGLLSAALAFYTGLSVAPLLVLLLWLAGIVGEDAQQAIQDQVQELIGPEGGRAIQMIIQNAAEEPDLGSLASLFSVGVLLFAATRVFNQLQLAMNLIWGVRAEPRRFWWGWARKRLISLAMIFSVGFLLLVSLVISAVLSYLSGTVLGDLPHVDILWRVLNAAGSAAIFMLLFAGVFRFLPDVTIAWRDVWVGAAVTALLFSAGKVLIGQYLGRNTLSSSYGAAGALIVFLLWVYYSAITMFLGAEITQVWARRHGTPIRPDEHAEWEAGPPPELAEEAGEEAAR